MGVELWAIAWIAAVVFGYFLPAIVAYRRKHRQREAILLLNLLLGWTVLGWIGALIWSVTASDPPVVVQESASPSKTTETVDSPSRGGSGRDPKNPNDDDPDKPNVYEIG